MTEAQRHLENQLQLLVDGRLDPAQRTAVESHLAECGRCRRELEAMRRVKAALREGLPQQPVPPHLAARVSNALATETARGAGDGTPGLRWWRRPILVGAALAAAAALVLLLARSRSPDLVQAAARDFAGYQAETLRLDLETSDPAALERHFAGAQLAFPTRVFDFGMMGYRLAGGGVHRLGGRLSALFVYRSADGDRLVCQMYQGTTAELPAPTEEREHDGIRFRIYRVDRLTLVFWQEGMVVCVLVADGDPEAAIQLAYAKAIRA